MQNSYIFFNVLLPEFEQLFMFYYILLILYTTICEDAYFYLKKNHEIRKKKIIFGNKCIIENKNIY